jgi:tol-pal system protein YbgF
MRGHRAGQHGRVGLALCFFLSGCAGVHEATGTASQQDLVQLRSDLAGLHTSAQRARSETETAVTQLERRVREQSAETQRQLAALAARVETLSTEIAALTSRTDELGQRLEAARKAALAARPATPPAAPPSPPAPAPSATAISRPTTGALQPEDIYQAAYIDFSRGSYQLAITQFREFVRRFPEHKLADNAQYWIGESHLGLAQGYAGTASQVDRATAELEEAVREFRKVIANYPRGDKVPTALYKEALALVELKQSAVARERLTYLIENFPRAEEALLARDRLAALKEK